MTPGCSIRCLPTPGRSATTAMPSAASSRRRADAVAHQERRRMQRAGADDHSRAAMSIVSPAAADAHADDAPAVEQHLLGLRLSHDRQIGPPPDVVRSGSAMPHPCGGCRYGNRRRAHSRRENAPFWSCRLRPAVSLDRRDHAADEARPAVLAEALQRIGPSLPCSGPSKSLSVSSFLKYGSTPSQSQPVAPQRRPSRHSPTASRGCDAMPLIDDVPPITRPWL